MELSSLTWVLSVPLAPPLHSNNEIYNPAEAAAMNVIDILAWTGGMFAGAALVTAGVGLIPIVGAGLLIGTLGYGSKIGVHYIFKKFD